MTFPRLSSRPESVLVLLSLVVLSSLAAAPKATPSPTAPLANAARKDYVSFKTIADRNIFDANRTSRSGRGGGDDRKPAKIDTFTLVGTLSYEKGFYAFFDGSSSDYKQVLEPGKLIAGYKIATVTGNGVRLEAATNTIELSVGMQMRREEEAPWKVVPGTGPQAASSTDSSTDSAPGDDSDIVKKLMQQREQELK